MCNEKGSGELRSKCSFIHKTQEEVRQAKFSNENRCNEGNAESSTGAMQWSGQGGRQRGYQKAGRVKKAGSKQAEMSKQSTESPTETNREKGSDRLEKRLAKQYSAVREEKSKAFVECVIRASCVISAMSDW